MPDSGEEMTLDLSSATITIQATSASDEESTSTEGTIDDITVGCMLTITMDGDTPVSVIVINSGMVGGFGGGQGGEAPTTDEATEETE